MIYRNAELKIEQLVTYLNSRKINLSPVFQRGRVWSPKQRKALLKNIIQKKPIPAIFLYKEPTGSRYTHNILDGKQRLESIILFIGEQRGDFSIQTWRDYIFDANHRRQVHFKVNIDEAKTDISQLEADTIRDFGEYVIPVIEITLDDMTTLDDIISLFVDINQQGVAVRRFDIVKAMCKNEKILDDTFKLIAIKQQRRQDTVYKMKRNDYTVVLRQLSIVSRARDKKSQVDRMWEKLLEICIFSTTLTHKKPSEILKRFISLPAASGTQHVLTSKERKVLHKTFSLLRSVYSRVGHLTFARDATHFYTMVTSLIKDDNLRRLSVTSLANGIKSLSDAVDSGRAPMSSSKRIRTSVKSYLDLSSKHTTDTKNRETRENLYRELVPYFSKRKGA